jgi:porin
MSVHSIALILAASATGQLTAPASDTLAGAGRAHSHVHSQEEINETHGPILLEASYTGEIMGNLSGGAGSGARYLDNLDLILEADLEELAGWRGAEAHIYGLYNNGASVGDLAGDGLGSQQHRSRDAGAPPI